MAEADAKIAYDVGGVLMNRPFKAGRLGHLGLFVDDMAAALHFYCDVLGFRVTDTRDLGSAEAGITLHFLTYNADHHAMVLMPKKLGVYDPWYAKGVTLNQISFQVGTLEEVVNAHALMRERDRNVFRIGRDVPGSNWAVYFRDPDGHMIEVYYGMEQLGWDGRSKPQAPFFERFDTGMEVPVLPRLAERDEIAEVEAAGDDLNAGNRAQDAAPARFDVGGVMLPRPFKIVRSGPIDLFVTDVDAAIDFYTHDMGFAVTEEATVEGHRAVFIRNGNDHHSIALFAIGLRDALGLPPHTTVAAYGLQVGSYKQLKDAAAYLTDAGYTLVDLPAALHTGIDYAVHLLDPDGHLVRLYYYMEQIGWDGRPRPAALRPVMQDPWPDTVPALPDTFNNRTFQGPLG